MAGLAVHNRKGQTLVIAIMVMFILSVIAAVFIGIVGRNLLRSERMSNADAVAQLADAGIRYADLMLTSSEDGADWRPEPDNITAQTWGEPPTPVANWEELRDRHPDFRWVRAYWPTELPAGSSEGQGYAGPSGGFTSFSSGNGRFLLRVSYNPNPKDPLSKHIKIESIGRWGVVINDDPTTWKPYTDSNLRREITAYKPIGVTDYLRFITNKDKRSADIPLGCEGYNLTYGRSDTSSDFGERGGPIRVNGNVCWYGNNTIYLRGVNPSDDTGTALTSVLNPIDQVEIAGRIKYANGSPVSVALKRMALDGSEIDTAALAVSDDMNFITGGGFYRDYMPDAPDADRRIKRIEPPRVDQPDVTNTSTRYRILTLSSGSYVTNSEGEDINLGEYGWGRGVYIGNYDDTQEDSQSLFGGYTQRSDWMQPNNPVSTSWKGPYYIPKAAIITLYPDMVDADGQYYFSITRTDELPNGKKAYWYDSMGQPRPDWGRTVIMPYPHPTNGRDVPGSGHTIHIDGNGVIYAEGNVRVRGMLPPDMQLTIASNENIYIDGNILKYRDSDAVIPNGDPWRGADETCGIALLARKNVVVNTTQFFAPQNSVSADDIGSDSRDGRPPFHLIVTPEPNSKPRIRFELGPWESESGTAPVDRYIFVRHSGEYGPSYINTWLNGGLLNINTVFSPPLPGHIWGVGDPNFGAAGRGIGSAFAASVFPLSGGSLNAAPGQSNFLEFALDQTTYARNNYLLGGVAVMPADIRIEAAIYAQEGSFYIIPGNWFNPDPSDTLSGTRIGGIDPRFPFFGQAPDIRIIVDGAITENVPAPIADTKEWMDKWSNIPESFGAYTCAHNGEGVTLLYDDHLAWPIDGLRNGGTTPVRTDKFARPLPLAPRLPVCKSLIYVGDVM